MWWRFLLAGNSVLGLSLSGLWLFNAAYVERYNITQKDVNSFAASCMLSDSKPACTAWQTANITLLTPPNVMISFNTGSSHGGVLSQDETSIVWADSSMWMRTPALHNLRVHILPHSHMDPGWYDTADFLYETLFKWIVQNVTTTLQENPSRTFTFEHAVILADAWTQGNATFRAAFLKLVANGRVSFAGGGWVQPDEAITHHEDLIDQLTLGHIFLDSVLNAPPVTMGWSADPFGHSSGMGQIYASQLLDLHLIGRPMSPLDPVTQTHSIWHPSASFPDAGALDDFSVLLACQGTGYWEPYRSTLRFLLLKDYASAAQVMVSAAQTLAAQFPGVHELVIMFGDDAPLQAAYTDVFPRLDQLIDYMNGLSNNITWLYSTPSIYLDALTKDAQLNNVLFPPRPEWDMVPLVGNEMPYWVGYYTSRPEFKQFLHGASAHFRASSMLHALAKDPQAWDKQLAALLPLWKALGLAQHHDAITGDCSDEVSVDYRTQVAEGIDFAGTVAGEAVSTLTKTFSPLITCFNASLSPCAGLTEALSALTPVTVTLFNPTAWQRQEFVSLLVPSWEVIVQDDQANYVPAQTAPYYSVDLPPSSEWYSLVFAAALPPLGTVSFTLLPAEGGLPSTVASVLSTPIASFSMGGPNFTLSFTTNGTLTGLKSGSVAVSAVGKMQYYFSTPGSENAWDMSTNGQTTTKDFATGLAPSALLKQGPLFDEMLWQVDTLQGIAIRYRIYKNDSFAHMFLSSGPFNTPQNISQDAIFRLETPLATAGRFWTDSNGLELKLRQRWARPFTTVNYTAMAGNEPVAINVFPVTSTAILSSNSTSIALQVSSSHGVTSMADGVLDVVLNRAIQDDKGVRQTGNRLATHHDLLSVHASQTDASTVSRRLSANLHNPVIVLVGPSLGPPPASFAPLIRELPPQLHLISMQLLPVGLNLSMFFVASESRASPVSSAVILVRIRHIYQKGMDESSFATPVTFDFSDFFSLPYSIREVQQVTINGLRDFAKAQDSRVRWAQTKQREELGSSPRRPTAFSVNLAPQQISTFIISFNAS